SFFINVDASETNGSMVLIGDRNLLLNGQTAMNTNMTLAGTNLLQWSGEIHRFQGNAALADGSVHSGKFISAWTIRAAKCGWQFLEMKAASHRRIF
ncbi:MAG: hypothetical protein K0Q55_1592, partial [Verrucomicrobia bacterium]|nr:hypothetical protein [Verrucomicrobiota bacterium]